MMMNLTIFLILGGFFSAVYSKTSDDKVINIGSIFTLKTIHGRVCTIAMKAAVDDVNSHPTILPGRRLNLSIYDANFSGFLCIMGALKYMEINTVAIIGPPSSERAHVLSNLVNELHVPLLSFTALDPTLSPLQYPYFLQTAPNDLYQTAAIAAILSYFRYSQLTAIFTDDDQFRNSINVLSKQLANRRCRLSGKAPLPPDQTQINKDVITAVLHKVMSMESRVILVHTYSITGIKLFEIANSLQMMKKGYVWIATTWLSTVLDSTGIPPKISASLHGVLTLRPHTADSSRQRAFKRRWKKDLSKGSIGLNSYGLYAYDTVWIIAYAVDKFLKEGGEISFSKDLSFSDIMKTTGLNLKDISIFNGGKQVLNNIFKTNKTGLTGPLLFNSDRSLRNPSFDVINILGTRGQLVGYWSNHSGLSIQTPESCLNGKPCKEQLGSIVWPGNMKDKPRGWEFSKNGRPLRIGVPLRASFKEMVIQINGSKKVGGFSIDVFLAAIKLLQYSVPYEFIMFGDGYKNPSYSQLVNQIASNVFDAAVGDISIVSNRTKTVDFTHPYMESGLVVVVHIRKPDSSSWAYLQPFSPPLWVVAAFLFVFVGLVVWLLEHRHNDEFRGPPKRQFITVLWFTFSTMFFAHRENTVSTLGRAVLIIWLFVVLIINSSYTASLTSILMVQQLQSPINGIESLIASNEIIGFQIGSFAENYLVKEMNIPRSRLVGLGSPEEFAEKLESGRVAAIVDERPYVDLFLSNHCNFQIVGQEFTKSGLGFAFPRDSPLAVDMSTAILTLAENGELAKIHDDWLKKEGGCGGQRLSLVSDHLELERFWGLFVIFGSICVVAVFIHFGITLYKFRKQYYDSKKPRERRYRRFLSFLDRKQQVVSRKKLKRKRMASNGNGNGREEVETI